MRRLAALCLLMLLVGCGPSSVTPDLTPGSIVFGMNQSHDAIQHPSTSFGPDDYIAYVARLNLSKPLAPHATIREFYTRISANGNEHPVLDDTFALAHSVFKYITFRFPVGQLYRVGFTAPAKYSVRLVHAGVTLAQGTFYLK